MMVYSYDSVLNSFMLSMQVIEYDKGNVFDFSLREHKWLFSSVFCITYPRLYF